MTKIPPLVRLRAPWWLAFGVFSAILAPHYSAHTRSTDVTWLKDIEPIIQTRCVGCHAPGGAAQMSLVSYREAQTNARVIREEVLEGRMPPWPAARGLGDFSNDRSLTPLEIELLTAWADGNAPLGNSGTIAPAPSITPANGPARTVSTPIGHPISSSERFEIPVGGTSTLWLSGWTFRPGAMTEVERAVVSVAGGDLIGSWTPGDGVIRFPSGIAQRLPAGSKIVVEIHYRKSTFPTMPSSAIDLFGGTPPRSALFHRTLHCGPNPVPRSVDAIAVTPTASAAGESVEIIARRPDGSVVPMVVIPQYDPANVLTYRLRRPIHLPSQSTIEARSSASECGALVDFTVPQVRESEPKR